MNKRRNALIEKHFRDNYISLTKRIAYRCNGDKILAEDIVQEAYARAIRFFPRYNPARGNFNQWFDTILRNAFNHVKNEETARGVSHEIDAKEGDFHTVPNELTVLPTEREHRFRTGLSKAINEERLRDKLILAMFFFDGFKSREIAEYINLNHNTVRQVINRFREKLVAVPVGVI